MTETQKRGAGEARTDTERLDWLQSQTRGYGKGWICRNSSMGRGMRLHETTFELTTGTVREAIDRAMCWNVVVYSPESEPSHD